MLIKGFFGVAPKYEPFVMATVRINSLNKQENVKFLVDTGASNTVIHDSDAFALGLEKIKLKKEKIGGIGVGGQLELFYVNNVTMSFETVDKKDYEINFEKLYVSYRGSRDNAIYRIPSLLGRDFLYKHMLFCKKNGNTLIISNEPKRLASEILNN